MLPDPRMQSCCLFVVVLFATALLATSKPQFGGFGGGGNIGQVAQDAAIGAEAGALAGAASGNPAVIAQDAAIGADVGAIVGETGGR